MCVRYIHIHMYINVADRLCDVINLEVVAITPNGLHAD